MEYYQIFIRFSDDGEKNLGFFCDVSLEQLNEQILKHYNNNEPFYFLGKIINASDIKEFYIFITNRKIENDVLPSGKTVMNASNYVILKMLNKREIENFGNVAHKLIRIEKVKKDVVKKENNTIDNKIFIVHGRDNEMKEAVARTLEKLDCDAIILHEQPNEGRTIIEKFSDYANETSFAVVLFSPDDMAYLNGDSYKKARPRARQNVLLELGFFMGKLERAHTIALCKKADDFEMPSNYKGVAYIEYDNNGHWKYALAKELKACKLPVDLNKI
jgi:predicted nucleotide-binding protein